MGFFKKRKSSFLGAWKKAKPKKVLVFGLMSFVYLFLVFQATYGDNIDAVVSTIGIFTYCGEDHPEWRLWLFGAKIRLFLLLSKFLDTNYRSWPIFVTEVGRFSLLELAAFRYQSWLINDLYWFEKCLHSAQSILLLSQEIFVEILRGNKAWLPPPSA